MSLRIGLLQCDHVADDLINIHGNYPDMFEAMLLAADPDIELAVYDLTADLFPVDLTSCDAYIITGSQFSVYDDVPWIHKTKKLANNLYQAKIPTIGICFGHQLIAEALGGKVNKAVDKGWGVGVHSWEVKKTHEWMKTAEPNSFALRASHQDQVMTLPPDATLLAGSEFCPIAGFQTGEHFLSFQGHPEFTRDYAEALILKRVERIGEATSRAALDSLKGKVDAEIVGDWIVQFIKSNV